MAFKKQGKRDFSARPGKPFRGSRPPTFSKGRETKRPFERRERPELYDAQCAQCGKQCQVPFRPSGAKPVYCRDCFRSDEPARPPMQSPGGQTDELSEINRKLDKIMRALRID